jgi:hypothetical protein
VRRAPRAEAVCRLELPSALTASAHAASWYPKGDLCKEDAGFATPRASQGPNRRNRMPPLRVLIADDHQLFAETSA